jgi:hypothetical protein
LPDILVVVFGTQVSWNVSLGSQETTWISCFVPVLQVARGGREVHLTTAHNDSVLIGNVFLLAGEKL